MRVLPKRKLISLAVIAICCGAISSTISAAPSSNANARAFSAGNPFTVDDLPPGLLKNQLKTLPDTARENALRWLHSIHFHENDTPFMQADEDGAIFFVDSVLPDTTQTMETSVVDTGDSEITVNEVFSLHSKPGASKVIHLDFDGHTLSGTAWNSTHATLKAQPYDLDNNPASFNTTEVAYMAGIWRRIAEDYAPFDVDVTTELPTQFSADVGRLLITKNTDSNGNAMPADTAGGVAYVNVWGRSDYSYYSPALVYYNNLGGGRPDYVAEAASHEMGHNMGLSHDATSTTSYYGGHGSGNISWGPIMGTGYGRNVSQWSKGEYTDANQFQDDIAIIAGKVNFRPDDHSDQSSQATALTITADGVVGTDNRGIIGSQDDVDVFSFATTGGDITLQAAPVSEAYTLGGNLDIALALYDQNGNQLAISNPAEDTLAQLNQSVTAGTYYLSVTGSGSANYTDYGSVGHYVLGGTLPANNDTNPPEPNMMVWANTPQAIDHQTISMTAATAVDDTSSVEYYFSCDVDNGSCEDSGWITSTNYTLTGLDAATTYHFRVKARDGFGNETIWSAISSAMTDAAPAENMAPTANPDTAEVLLRSSVDIPVLDNDTDPENDGLTLVTVSSANKGSVSINGNQVTYVAGSKRGGDIFTYTMTDNNGNDVTGTVTIAIVRNLSDGSDDSSGGGKGSGKGNKK